MRIARVILVLLFYILSKQVSAQDIQSINIRMSSLPAEMTASTDKLSTWIAQNYTTDRDRVSAIFIWLANNISYDVSGMYNTQYYKSPEDAINRTLATRMAVCQGYAAVMHALCLKMNIPAWIVAGYTRQFGKVVPQAHAWNAVIIDKQVYLFDPTWGAGYVMDGAYTARFNLDYFMRTPEQMRPSHMPFDPLWQFSHHPISPEDFDAGRFESSKSAYFNFTDTLTQYSTLTPIEQSMSRLRRIEQNGITNELVKTEASYLQVEIRVFRQNQVINQMNAAVLNFNEGVSLFNKYVNLKNKQFKTVKSDNELKSLVDTTMNLLTRAEELVHGLEGPDPATNNNIRQLEKSIQDLLKKVREEKTFTMKYLGATPEVRKKMFYQ